MENIYMTSQQENFENEGLIVEAPEVGTLAVLNKSEIDQQIATAKRFPRQLKKFRNDALELATLDEDTAAECLYALPRDGKTIEGPSARFAEILSYCWGNSRSGARVVNEDAEFVTSQGMFYDLEKNVAIAFEVRRRITDKKGRRYSADMIGTTSNAAGSIAHRNAVLKGIPKALWKPILDAARKVVAGDMKTLANRREEALKAFAIYGVKPEQIYSVLAVGGKEDVTIDHLVTLRGMLTALKEGEVTPEAMFKTETEKTAEHAASKTESKLDELKKKYADTTGRQAGKQQPVENMDAEPAEVK